MSNDNNQLTNEQFFQRWLEGELTAEQSVEFEQRAANDKELQQRLATARVIEQQVHCYEQAKVPDWDRHSTFDVDHTPWWQWHGLPALSMAFSVFAICLVVFKVELVSQDNGFAVNFGGGSEAFDSAQVDALVTERLQQFANEQELVMANYKSELKDSQQDNNLQLASYVLSATRQERNEDISDFIKYVNEQRSEDSIEQKLRFQKLEYKLQSQSLATQMIKNKVTPAKYKLGQE